MGVGGIPIQNSTHAIDACLAALEILEFMKQMKEIKTSMGLPFWELRLGIHSGSVVGGVIGKTKFAYDIWGDTVNTASRMESFSLSLYLDVNSSISDSEKCIRNFPFFTYFLQVDPDKYNMSLYCIYHLRNTKKF